MPAVDTCEPVIIRALAKEGWAILDRPYSVRFQAKGKVFADLRLQNVDGQQIIVVEVKCFPKSSTMLDEFYQAVGQYVFYRNILQLRQVFSLCIWRFHATLLILCFKRMRCKPA